MEYDSKVSPLEDRNDLDILRVDELHGILTTYKMRTRKNYPSRKEATFKAIKSSKKFKAPPKNHSEFSDNEEALFIKKLERGTIKYKEKLPLKCYNCGRIRHFASKCPYSKQDDSDKREVSKKFKKGKKGNKKKILYTMEYSEDEDTSGDEET